jgi:hypothetical protein
MSAAEPETEWRTVYGTKQVLFVDGRGVGDYYQAGDGVFRVRLWPHFRLQGGAEQLVLSKNLAEQTLLEMYQWRKQDEQ